ncbi:hypothetical protein FNV43_RR06024 [Rhamnella rubrinervis]|uniref:Protein TIFY n=1 Tax=Rhamnella rubrinervis TaxID=2594499 RepID=A0A8K0MLK7_9ROSA|nr:hypothetical protein FNV43_RR06024 [Rhamnella rubrinervis]
MRRNCNLELRLLPSSSSSSSSFFSDNQHHRQTANMKDESTSESPPSQRQQLKQHQQQLTIFYNGNMCVCDVTELQARAILFYASREMEEKMMTMRTPKYDDAEYSPAPTPTPTTTPTPTGSSTSTVVQMSSPTAAGLSMKRSLQRFLQKRKHRVHATSPYHH